MTYLNEESAAYFEKVKQYLNDLGISYEIDPNLVRGLDYYNHTAFEIMSNAEGFGAITTLAGGGRYDGLVEQIGGPEAPGIGFAIDSRCNWFRNELRICYYKLGNKRKIRLGQPARIP